MSFVLDAQLNRGFGEGRIGRGNLSRALRPAAVPGELSQATGFSWMESAGDPHKPREEAGHLRCTTTLRWPES